MGTIDDLLELPAEKRLIILNSLSERERAALYEMVQKESENPWRKYAKDPVRFVIEGLGEDVWSKQVEVLESLRDNIRTVVPACHAPGKSHIAARAIAWWVAVHPIGTARVVTTANTYRQVRNILWPHIRRVVTANNLPGEVLMTEWKIGNEVVADGFSPADHNETAVQGIHAEHLLIVVDEAGGISNIIGQALEALMTGDHTRLLVLGNPPTDNMGSWFERICNNQLFNVIPISAYDTPNFTGENIGPWKRNLVDPRWVNEVKTAFGEDSPFVQARVYARFPRSNATTVIPIDWVESATQVEAPEGAIRLGVDVAAEGGDEFVIAKMCGMTASIVHTSKDNANPVEVAGRVLEAIHEAQNYHDERKIYTPVRVKVDSIGVGWGIVGLLADWGKEGRHNATIVPVNVSQSAYDRERFSNQKAEMWWTARELLQPDENGEQALALDVDRVTQSQLAAPSYRSNSSGRIQIEGKDEMKKRGIGSPDRAEALLLALFEPPAPDIPEIAPLSITKKNTWTM